MLYSLENEKLKIEIDTKGAELVSVISKASDYEYMWHAGDSWKRHSPVLFPIVGGIKDKTYTYKGREYHLNQHGFARDMEFKLREKTEEQDASTGEITKSISFILREDDTTIPVFPFSFRLIITYTLIDSIIGVNWKVINPNDCEMSFSIGGHPAFMCPLTPNYRQTSCYLHFDQSEGLEYNLLSENGLCLPDFYNLDTDDGYVQITSDFFDKDALVFYNDRLRSVSLAGPDKKDYLKVTFDAPVYGIWSAKGKHAPFVCIEPWYGRCDDEDFNGTWQERKFSNELEAGESFEAGYTIEVLE